MENIKLETMIDKNGLAGTLDDVTAICYAKAEHILANWQDKELAAEWMKAAKLIDALSSRIDRLSL